MNEKTQSELILAVLGTTVEKVVEAHNKAKETGATVIGFAMSLPDVKILGLPVVFSNNVKEVEALVSTNRGAIDDGLQVKTLPTPTPSNRNEQDTPEPSITLGDGDGEDRRDDKHTPPPIPESLKSKKNTDPESACHFI